MAVTVLGTLGVLALLNALFGLYLERYEPNRGYRSVGLKWGAMLEQPRVDWVVLGDSVADQSVIPSVVGEALGGTCRTYATTGHMGVISNAWLLDRFVARHGPPRGVILLQAYDVWRRPVALAPLARIPLGWGFWKDQNPPLALDAAEQGELFVHRFLPLVSRETTLVLLCTNPAAWFRPPPAFAPDGMRIVHEAEPREVYADTERHIGRLRVQPRFTPHAQVVRALKSMRELAERHAFPIYVAGPPVHEGLAKRPEFAAYYAGVREMLAELAAGSRQVHFVLREPMPFPADSMDNADHLVFEAARSYTRRLVAAILQEPGFSR